MSKQGHNLERGFTPRELNTILNKRDLKDKVNLLVGQNNLISFATDFAKDQSKEYACILYIKGNDPISHKSCILLSKQKDGKVDIILSDSVKSESPLMIRELSSLDNALSRTNSNGRTFVNQYPRLGSTNGCGGFAISDVIYYADLEDKSRITDKLYELRISESKDGKIVFYDLPPKLMENCQFLDPRKEESIASYLERNNSKITSAERDRLLEISHFNTRNDIFIQEMYELLATTKPSSAPTITADKSTNTTSVRLNDGGCVIS